jgi:hypothetical protein
MRAIRAGLFCSIALEILCLNATASEPLVSVVNHAFSKTVMANQPGENLPDPVSLKRGERLYLWLEIQVNPAGRKYLKTIGKLPVYIRWGRDGWLTDPPIDIGITPETWEANAPAIGWKAVEGGGMFLWRTNARKTTQLAGRYYAMLLDANKRLIATLEMPHEAFRPAITIETQ